MKKFLSVLLSLFLGVFMLSGCNIIVRNDYRYYNQIVAEADGYSFTLKDLVQAYNLYGSSYVDEQSYTYEDAMKQTMEDMINRKLLVEQIVKSGYLSYTDASGNTIAFDKAYGNDIMREVYSQIDTQLASKEDEVCIDWDIPVASDDEDETTEDDTSYKPYSEERTYTLTEVNGVWTLVKDSIDEEMTPDLSDAGDYDYLGKSTDKNQKVVEEAWSRYLKELRDTATTLGEKDLSDKTLLKNEIDRIYQILRANKVLSLYQTKYAYEEQVDMDSIIDNFTSNYLSSYESYKQTLETTDAGKAANEARLSAYQSAMSSDASTINYHISNQYVQVSHILLSFDNSEKNELEEKLNQFKADNVNSYATEEEFEQAVQAKKKELSDAIVINGKTVNEIVTEVEGQVQPSNEFKSLYRKADAFNTLMYKYTGDPGLNNASFGYVVPLDESVESNYVDEFKAGARLLAEENSEGGNITTVYTDYGVHIMLNLGLVGNNGIEPVVTSNGVGVNVTIEKLWKTRRYAMYDKTLFDECYSNVVSSTVNDALQNLVDQARGATKSIVTYEYRYESLWK